MNNEKPGLAAEKVLHSRHDGPPDGKRSRTG
jgi:hypothetical protein